MTLALPPSRLPHSGLVSRAFTPCLLRPLVPRRNAVFDMFKRNANKPSPSQSSTSSSNPILEQYLKNKPKPEQYTLVRGDLTTDSIFEADRREQRDAARANPKPKLEPRNKHIMSGALDPDPVNRKRWERKMVIRSIRKRGRLSPTELRKQTERELLSKSPMIITSVKKLTKLAHQITGKTVDDAITQMRFSKKKAAVDVRQHLEYARDEAIVKRGMGLGDAEGTRGEELLIENKEGKTRLVKDRTKIYIEQAWVGRGAYGQAGIDYRARGRAYLLRQPRTTVSVVLKEEATRVREHEDRMKKRANRKLWVQLPDRPVTAQRQYYCW